MLLFWAVTPTVFRVDTDCLDHQGEGIWYSQYKRIAFHCLGCNTLLSYPNGVEIPFSNIRIRTSWHFFWVSGAKQFNIKKFQCEPSTARMNDLFYSFFVLRLYQKL
jgi:hypothetical protein